MNILSTFFTVLVFSSITFISSFANTFEDLLKDLSRNSSYFSLGLQEDDFDYSAFLHRLEQFHLDIKARKIGFFVAPNEPNPARFLPVFERAPKGTIVSVGTERGLADAALSKSPRLVLVDMDPAVYLFNWINVHLLTVTESREDYFFLRHEGNLEQWETLVFNFASNFPQEKKKVIQSLWDFWTGQIREKKDFQNMREGKIFPHANYLLEDQFYDHLKQMANTSQILILNTSLESEKLIQFLDETQTKIAILDFSNTVNLEAFCNNIRYGEEHYLSVIDFIRLAYRLREKTLLDEDSLILSTHPDGVVPSYDAAWVYCSLPFAALLHSLTFPIEVII